jgi:FtsP/CotA-like multicopper oxidase with cupredoxin domain
VPQRTMMIQSTELCDPTGRSVPFALTAMSASDPENSGSEPCDFPGQLIPKPLTNERFTPLLINGTINPTVKIRPGEIQRWRIFNANNNRIVVLGLEGQAFEVLAKDGNTLPRMQAARILRCWCAAARRTPTG